MKIVAVILFIFFIVIIAGAYWLTQQQMKNVVVPVDSPVPENNSVEVMNEIDGWETYVSEQFGFKLKYPKVFSDGQEITVKEYENYVGFSSPTEWGFTISFQPNTLLDERIQHIKDEYNINNWVLNDLGEVSFNGYDSHQLELVTDQDTSTFILLERKDGVIEIDARKEIEAMSQILSTFEFTDSPSNSETSNEITLDQDLTSPVSSPLVLTGTVDPSWMYEGQFMAKLLDENRKVIVQAPATEEVPGSWMSGEPVKFSARLEYQTQNEKGYLVFENDNPSGLPENSKQVEYEVTFK